MYINRTDAATRLAQELLSRHIRADVIVGLARGGVAVSVVLARMLHASHDVLVVKKIGSPQNPEYAIGARVPEGQSIDVRGKSVIITDDGAATGATMKAAIGWMKKNGTKKIIVALPVAPPETAKTLKTLVDNVIILETPATFEAVSQFYRDFKEITDKDVVQLLS